MQVFLKQRLIYGLLAGMVIAAGLATRTFGSSLPSSIALYGGDTLWAMMVFLGLAFLFPAMKPRRLFFLTILFSFSVELSQLYHAPWIDSIRATRLGGLVLGYGFLWSDLLCYTLGALGGTVVDVIFLRRYSLHPLT